MDRQDKKTDQRKISESVTSRIKNSDRVREKHQLIAKKAAKLFIKKGYPQTTIREISKATGMAMGNLYDYISKKEDVLCLVFDVYHRHIEDSAIIGKYKGTDDPRRELQSFIHGSLQNVREFHDEIILMYRESGLLPKKNLKQAMQRELSEIRVLEKIIRRGIERKVFKVQDPFFAASMVFYQLVIPALRGWTFKGKYSEIKVNKLLEDYIIKNILA